MLVLEYSSDPSSIFVFLLCTFYCHHHLYLYFFIAFLNSVLSVRFSFPYYIILDSCWMSHSTASRTCVVWTHSTFGDRAFAAAGPRLWNSLPSHLKDADLSYSEFRRSFLFGQWGHGTWWTVLTAPSRNIRTYLFIVTLRLLQCTHYWQTKVWSYCQHHARDLHWLPVRQTVFTGQ